MTHVHVCPCCEERTTSPYKFCLWCRAMCSDPKCSRPRCAGRSEVAHVRTSMNIIGGGWKCPVCGELEPVL